MANTLAIALTLPTYSIPFFGVEDGNEGYLKLDEIDLRLRSFRPVPARWISMIAALHNTTTRSFRPDHVDGLGTQTHPSG